MLLNTWLKSWKSCWKQRDHRRTANRFKSVVPTDVRLQGRTQHVDSLESRLMLSTINWSNRGNVNNDSDGFNSVFGANAQVARNVVDSALLSWQSVISSFQFANAALNDTYQMTVNMATTGVSQGASAGGTAVLGGKPTSGTATIGRGLDTSGDGLGDGGGWFLDPTPQEHSEFLDTINNAFSAKAPALNPDGSANPIAGQADLYSVVLHEFGHALGLTGSSAFALKGGGYAGVSTLTNAGGNPDADTDSNSQNRPPGQTITNPGFLWRFDGPSIRYLFTSYNSADANGQTLGVDSGGPSHAAAAGQTVTENGVTYIGSDNLMNPRYAFGTRELIPDTLALVLRDAYGYTTNDAADDGTFNAFLQANGQLLIRGGSATSGGLPSSDSFNIFKSGSNIVVEATLGNVVPGSQADSVLQSSFPISGVTSIAIDAGDGDDFIRISPLHSSIAITVGGGNGTDTLEVVGSSGNDVISVGSSVTSTGINIVSNSSIDSIVLRPGQGVDDVYGTSHVTPFRIELNTGGSTLNLQRLWSFSPVTINGSSLGDVVNIAPSGGDIDSPVIFNGFAGSDSLTLGNGTLAPIFGHVTFHGGTGTADRVVLNDHSVSTASLFSVTASSVTRHHSFGGLSYSNLDRIVLNCGSGADTIDIANGIFPNVEAHGNDGPDTFVVGGGNLTGFQPQNYDGGNGNDTIIFDDHLDATSRIWDIRDKEVLFGGLIPLTTEGFEAVGILGGTGHDEFTFQTVIGQSLNINGGSGSNHFILGFQNPVFFSLPVTLTGGDGSDTFTINHAGIGLIGSVSMDGGSGFNHMNVHQPLATGFDIWHGYSGNGAFTPRFGGDNHNVFGFANINSAVYNGNAGNNLFTVYSAGRDFGSVTINGGLGNDTFRLAPQPSGYTFEHLKIDGNQGVDTFIYDSSALTTDERYTIGSNTLAVTRGLGTETITTANLVQITLTGGSGNDVIALSEYSVETAVAVNGGPGDDTLNFGGSTLASLNSGTQFIFSGGTGFDRINVNNTVDFFGWTYTLGSGNLHATRTLYGGVTLIENSTEEMTVNAGPNNDTFFALNSASGMHTIFNGAGGYDTFQPGAIGLGTGLTTLSLLSGAITFDAGTATPADGGRLIVSASGHSDAKTVHLDASTLSAKPGDNLFGFRGSLEFFNITDMSLTLGKGADVVYAQPLANATVQIVGNSPTASPGDTLNLLLETAQDYVLNGSGISGSVTSTNLRTLSYSGFETGPNVVTDVPIVGLANQIPFLPENTNTVTRIKMADVIITDDGVGINTLTLSGADADFFELDGTTLYLKAGTVLDFETKTGYAVTVNVDDSTIGDIPDSSVEFILTVSDRGINWIGGSGDWNTAANWLDENMVNRVPAADDEVTIDAAAEITVTHLSGLHSVLSLTINAPFRMSGGTLTVTGNLLLQNSGTFTMTAGILRSATLIADGDAVFAAANATFDDITLGATVGGIPLSATVQVNGGALTVTGGMTFSNGSSLVLNNHMNLFGGQTLSGEGEIRFQTAGGSGAQINTSGQTTFDSGLTIHRADAGSTDIFMNGGSVTNRATIRSDAGGLIRVTGTAASTFLNGIGGVLAADGGTLNLMTTWSSTGQIVVNNSTINLGGSFTTDGIGSISRTAGMINVVGLLDNTGRIFAMNADTGSWNLTSSGTWRRGSLVTSDGATLAVAAGTLDSLTLGDSSGETAAVAIVRIVDNSFVKGGLTFVNGSIVHLDNKQVNFVGDQTIGGAGEIRLQGAFGNIVTFNHITFGPGLLIHRADANSSVIAMGGAGSITNQATIRADAGGQISVGNFSNVFTNAANGVLEAAGGTLVVHNSGNYLGGTLTGGTWQAIGNSTLRIVGTGITTNAAKLILDGAGARLTRDQSGNSALTNLSSNAAAGSVILRNGAGLSTAGSFSNEGSLTVGTAGIITINGAFSQHSDGALTVEIGDTPTSGLFGRLVSTGTAVLDGILKVSLVNSYQPDQGLSYSILSFASRIGKFASINGLVVGDTEIFEAVYDETHLTLTSEINEPPIELFLDQTSVAENMPQGTPVGSLTTTDPDAANSFIYTLVSGVGDADNANFQLTGATLATSVPFDYETKNSYSVRIRSTDQGGLFAEQVFTISVTNVTELNGIDVQNGQTQRSFLRTLDAIFDQADGLMDLINNNRLQLTRFDLNGQNGSVMTMPIRTATGNRIVFDFGVQGIGGNRNTNAGDGYYELAVDLDGNGSFESQKYFHRLLGDVNGDGVVSSADKSQVLSASRSTSVESDVNGDGLVNILDTSLVSRAVGRRLKGDLFRDD